MLNQLLELLTGVNSTVVLVWIPSHIGLTGNEIPDGLAGSTVVANAQVDVHWPRLEALTLGAAYAACPAWKERRKKDLLKGC